MFKKKGGAPKNLRKRELEGGAEAEDNTAVTKAATAAAAGLSSSSNSSSTEASARNTSTAVVFASDRSTTGQTFAGGAFSTNEVDTEVGRDAQSILERNIALKQAGSTEGVEGAKLYVGASAYKTFTVKDDLTVEQARASMKSKGTQGPLRAPAFIRTTAVFDYQPDVCKDYKETGFCGFGDSCLYMHDRSDYKTGWQQEKEWDEQQAKKKKRIEEASALSAFAAAGEATESGGEFAYAGDAESMLKLYAEREAEAALEKDQAIVGHKEHDYSKGMPSQMQQIQNVKSSQSSKEEQEDEALPFACFICRHPFVSPVATNCSHYFCQACIIAASKKSSKCPVCKKHTGGVFNVAHKILAKMKQP